MKTRAIVLSCVVGLVVLFMGYEYSRAASETDRPTLKIGVVSVQKILQNCKRSAMYREKTAVERDKIVAELEKLNKEIEAEEAGLKTLKAGSSDYLTSMKEILEKQARWQARQEFEKQRIALKQHQIIEDIYQEILRKTSEIAELKGLDMVFERSEPELPAPNASALSQTISTHKLLYSGGCLDITDEVMALVDAGS